MGSNRWLCSAAILLFLCVAALPVNADVCVWRDPERTMARLFPEARDYRTVLHKLAGDQVARIEALAGQALTPDEKREFHIYEITDGRRVIGKVLALAGRGEYGVIETVIGLGLDDGIRGVYLQRVRERQRKALQSEDFLRQFQGLSQGDELQVDFPPGAEKPGQVVAEVVRKMLAFNTVLTSSTKP